MTNKINVLDKGYVVLHEVMGDDLTVVNAARCSYARKSEELSKGDRGLINFLARESHTSPFRHTFLQFEINAPLMVTRQHFKYLAGSSFQEATGDNMTAWNEESRRYVRDEPSFYIPKDGEWRSYPDEIKQGSGEPLNPNVGIWYTNELERYVNKGERMYNWAMESGIAPEQARLFLPANGLYVKYYWSASLQSVAHFIKQRMADDSQHEIHLYAKAVLELSSEHFPVSLEALTKGSD